MRTVGPTIAESFNLGDKLLNTLDARFTSAIVGTLVEPVLGIHPGFATVGVLTTIILPDLGLSETIAEPRGARDNRSEVSLPHASSVMIVGVGML